MPILTRKLEMIAGKIAGIKGGTIQFMADVVAERPQDISAFYQAYN